MSVFREVDITFDGANYTFVPSLALMRRIDGLLVKDGMSITKVVYEAGTGNWPVAHMALIIAEVLRAAGAKVDDEQLYSDLMNDPVAAIPLYTAVVAAISPAPSKKKPEPSQSAAEK